ncbi:hypothetical protein C8T65DRAFT_727376 [Cerioporus squamosus]|nr:hypothetical protein C8T65DRAFT_727376 [Cerioporus squamosus]
MTSHGGFAPMISSHNRRPLSPEYESPRGTRIAHSRHQPVHGGMQYGASADTVSQSTSGHGWGYVTMQASHAQPHGAFPTATPYGMFSGAQSGTSLDTSSASNPYADAEDPYKPLWWQGATNDPLFPSQTFVQENTTVAGWDSYTVTHPAPAGYPSPSHEGGGAEAAHGSAPQHPYHSWYPTQDAANPSGNMRWD